MVNLPHGMHQPVGGGWGARPEAALLDAMQQPFAVRSAAGAVLHVNRVLVGLLGCASDDCAGLDEVRWEEMIRTVLRPASEPFGGGEEECPWETLRLPRRVFLRSLSPLPPAGGQDLQLEGFRDVTAEVRMREETTRSEARHQRDVAALQTQVAYAESFKMELTANVTHDLRTPLASIKASVSGLLAGDVTYNPAHLRETLTVIEEETDRLQRRVQNLLAMSRMESGNADLDLDWVDLADVVATALESLRAIYGTRQVDRDFPDDLPLVQADYDQLQIAIRNLLENAFLYSPPDTAVEILASHGLGQVRLRVRDYGPGLMPDEFERVFDKFYRGRANRRIPGTGLGLPICRGITEAHGGRLWAEHVPGGGVQFVLSLPDPKAEGE